MLSQLFVFLESKNFTSDIEIRESPIAPIYHYVAD